jgi:two-component system, NarL family, response regulator DevR
MSPDETRVIIVDDHSMVRQGLHSLLSQYSDIQVVGEAEGGPAALELIDKLQPDIVLLDIRLTTSTGLDLARELRRAQSKSRIIILTSYDDEGYLLQAAQAGVHGYLLKSASAESLAEAIRAVHAGERRLSPTLLGTVLRQFEDLATEKVRQESGLSAEEIDVLHLISEGATNKEIAAELYWSEISVKRKLQDIFAKLGVSSRLQAAVEAVRRGLV